MRKLSAFVPVSDFSRNAAKVLKQVRDSKEPLVITQRGRASAVMLRVEAYERLEHDSELLHLLARGDAEIEAGEGHDLQSVLAEAHACRSGWADAAKPMHERGEDVLLDPTT